MWDWIVNILFVILQGIQSFAGDWGLSIIILVAIIRLLLTPLQVKAFQSTARMQVLQPKMMEIQKKYEDDPQRMQQEMQRFQQENKFNPLGGCLPLLIQMPVFFALFTLLRDLPQKFPNHSFSFYGILPDLTANAGGVMSQSGVVTALPYIITVILFGVLTLIPSLLQARGQSGAQAKQMQGMSIFMGLFMIFIGWGLPGGVNLYYVVSAAWGVVQQIFVTQKVIEKEKAKEEERQKNKPIEVDVVRRERKQRPHKSR